MTRTRSWTRCIVLTPIGLASDAPIVRLAAARDWITIEQRDPYLAMAELCIRQRAQKSRQSWGLASAEKLALVIVDLEHWEHLTDFLEAIERFAPGVSIWTLQDNELTAITPPEQLSPPKPIPNQAQPQVRPQAMVQSAHHKPLRIAGTDRNQDSDRNVQSSATNENDERNEADDSGGITPLEIKMLLAMNQGDEDGA